MTYRHNLEGFEMTDENKYHARFRETGERLSALAERMNGFLLPHDIGGVFFAVGIEAMSAVMSPHETATWLRSLADSLDIEGPLN